MFFQLDMYDDWVQNSTGLPFHLQQNILHSAIVLLLVWVIYRVILLIIFKKLEDPRSIYHWRKTIAYTFSIMAILLVGRIWIEGMQSVATFLGLLSAGIAIALKEPLVNIAGWLFILIRKPFQVGDRIKMGDFKGDVIDQRVFTFSLMEIGNWVGADQSTGRVLNIPNAWVFNTALANYHKGFQYLWHEIAFSQLLLKVTGKRHAAYLMTLSTNIA